MQDGTGPDRAPWGLTWASWVLWHLSTHRQGWQEDALHHLYMAQKHGEKSLQQRLISTHRVLDYFKPFIASILTFKTPVPPAFLRSTAHMNIGNTNYLSFFFSHNVEFLGLAITTLLTALSVDLHCHLE